MLGYVVKFFYFCHLLKNGLICFDLISLNNWRITHFGQLSYRRRKVFVPPDNVYFFNTSWTVPILNWEKSMKVLFSISYMQLNNYNHIVHVWRGRVNIFYNEQFLLHIQATILQFIAFRWTKTTLQRKWNLKLYQ